MSSPIAQPGLHDTFVLLIGSKRIVLPGTARVTVGLAANLDVQDTAGEGNTQTQLNEATGEVTVQLTMTEHAEWLKYRDVLAIFRRGTEPNKMAIFACAHPEVASRRIKRLYFVSEQATPYSPRSGYMVSLVFREQLKAKTTVAPSTDDGKYTFPGQGGDAPPEATGGTPAGTPLGQRLAAVALVKTFVPGVPIPGSGGKTTASPGYCSAFARDAWMATHNGDRSLFGDAAGGTLSTNTTEGRFKAAGYLQPYVKGTVLPAGTMVFYGNDPSKNGHLGISDGKGNVISNNFVTYGQRGGLFDAAGRATGYDKAGKPVDARGIQPIDALGTPTSIASPNVGSLPAKLQQKPKPPQSAPKPVSAPSNNVPKPPGAFKLVKAVNATPSQFPGVKP